MPKSRRGRIAAAGAISVLALALIAPLATAALTDPSPVAAPAPDRVTDTSRLPAGWRQSDDRMVTYDGDSTGLHVLVADAAHAYAWRTAATLSEPGFDTDQWIGQSCVTASGERAVVVYAPRQTVNDQQGFQQGGFAAVVDLAHGTVTKLPQLVSLAYFNPGCGDGEQAVLSRPQGEDTQLLTVDAREGKLTRQQTVPGQLTSAVPFGSGIAAATGDTVVAVDREGRLRTLARPVGTPFRLVPDADGGLAYQVPDAAKVQVRRVTQDGSDRLLGSGALGALAVRGTGGRVFVTGEDAPGRLPDSALPKSWAALDVPASSEVSTTGALALTSVGDGSRAAGEQTVEVVPSSGADTGTATEPVRIHAVAPGTGADFAFRVNPRTPRRGQGAEQSPALSARTGGGAPSAGMRLNSVDDGPEHTTTDPDRTCAVTRNDPGLQALQPSPAMVEWATDLAVQGRLDVRRRTGWNGTDLASYTPQGLFPPVALKGGGRMPAQILLGVLAQESNLSQASSRAVAGESGNFVQGGYYGNGGSVHTVDWSAADCGYGIGQVTSGMARSDTGTYTDTQQKALAVDYAANIAASARILQDKWNQLYGHGILANGGDPQYLENWWFALWAYNSGFNEPDPSDTAAPWGLGWFNNPANGLYPADRGMFLASGPDDARVPNQWTYPERVLGWAAYSQRKTDPATGASGPAFTVGSWPAGGAPDAQPPHDAFCDPAVNECDTSRPRKVEGSSQPEGPCQRDDFRCWWHEPVTWTDCAATCGTEALAHQAADPEPAVTTTRPASCVSSLPADALIVDDVPNTVKFRVGATHPCAGKDWTSRGTLSFTFGSAQQNGATVYPSKIDFHQLGAGFGGHFWFTHTRVPSFTDSVVTGTWTPDRSIRGWARVMVHLPDHEATTGQATYRVDLGDGTVVETTISQDTGGENAWVALGSYAFQGIPSVSLSSDTADGTGDDSIAWDALAFEPLPGKPSDAVTPSPSPAP